MLNLPLIPLGAAALVAAALATADDDTEADPSKRHERAPRGVPLIVTEGTRLLAADADDGHDEEDDYAPALFERLNAQFPGRFTQDDEDVWRDSWPETRDGAIVWDDENECYWEVVSADRLTRGRQDYVQFCASCHAMEGDGYGRSGMALRPPPRDFHQGLFKFAKVNSEKLPDDDALVALILGGLNGTPMNAWDVSEERVRDIVTYVKSLSTPGDEDGDGATGWRDPYNQIASVIDATDDPWADDRAEAVAEGERLYHKYQCYTCHPAYATPARTHELREASGEATYPDDHTYPKLRKDSSYEVLDYKVAILPPDFTWHEMRRGATVAEIYQTIAGGVAGAGMPTWKGAAPDEELWAIAHYVDHLTQTYKGKDAERAAFMRSIR